MLRATKNENLVNALRQVLYYKSRTQVSLASNRRARRFPLMRKFAGRSRTLVMDVQRRQGRAMDADESLLESQGEEEGDHNRHLRRAQSWKSEWRSIALLVLLYVLQGKADKRIAFHSHFVYLHDLFPDAAVVGLNWP